MITFEPYMRAVSQKISLESRKRACKRLILGFTVMLSLICVLFGKVFAISIVHGDSMEPLLYNGDMAVFSRMGKFEVGDVVIVRMNQTNYVKRVIGMGGDVVTIDARNGEVLVNGQRERYSDESTYRCQDGMAFPTTVPADSVFVLGDNRQISKDSREFGPVEDSLVVGTLLWVLPTGGFYESIESITHTEA